MNDPKVLNIATLGEQCIEALRAVNGRLAALERERQIILAEAKQLKKIAALCNAAPTDIHVCPECGKDSPTRNGLGVHRRSAHGVVAHQ